MAEIKKEKPTLNLRQMRDNDSEMVRGKFVFFEVPGGTLNFAYRKYKGEQIQNYSLKDGEVVSIPRGVAKHLAKSGNYPIHEYATDEFGKPLVRIGRMKQRYSFQSMEFFDDLDSEPSKILTAEKVLI